MAAPASKTPPRCRSLPLISTTSSFVRTRNGEAPAEARVLIVSSQLPSWLEFVAVHSQPAGVKSASIPLVSQNLPVRTTASSDAAAIRSASSVLISFFKVANFGHQVMAKPPFAPLAPAPQMSASTTPTRIDGSSPAICSAVHRPVSPPPTTQTSSDWSPWSAGAAT